MINFRRQWILVVLVAVILIIFIVTSITSRKRKKLEREKRQKEVKNVIKEFMRNKLNLQHKRVEFDEVLARNSKEYRYRDVFDVIVKMYDSRSNELYEKKAFEVEGFTKVISKKEYLTTWKVNCELNLETTLKNIALQKTSKRKLNKKDPEVKKRLEAEKAALKKSIEQEKLAVKAAKKRVQQKEKPQVPISEKFTGLSS